MGEKPTHRTFANGRDSRGTECSRHRHDLAWWWLLTGNGPQAIAPIPMAPLARTSRVLRVGDRGHRDRQGCRDARLCAPSTYLCSIDDNGPRAVRVLGTVVTWGLVGRPSSLLFHKGLRNCGLSVPLLGAGPRVIGNQTAPSPTGTPTLRPGC